MCIMADELNTHLPSRVVNNVSVSYLILSYQLFCKHSIGWTHNMLKFGEFAVWIYDFIVIESTHLYELIVIPD